METPGRKRTNRHDSELVTIKKALAHYFLQEFLRCRNIYMPKTGARVQIDIPEVRSSSIVLQEACHHDNEHLCYLA